MAETKEFVPLHTPQPPVPTTKIVDADAPDGFVIINASEFDAKKHKKYVEKAAE